MAKATKKARKARKARAKELNTIAALDRLFGKGTAKRLRKQVAEMDAKTNKKRKKKN